MKRSEINKIIVDALAFADKMNFLLPPFARWTPEEWAKVANNPEYDEIRDNMLGWDITDFGSGDYHKIGLLMFTIRNGNKALCGKDAHHRGESGHTLSLPPYEDGGYHQSRRCRSCS